MAMFWKTGNVTLTALQSLSPPHVASPSQSPVPHLSTAHARPQVSASEPPQQAKDEAPSQTSPALTTRVVENLMHKNELHSHCQKVGIPLPVYQTAVEGLAHAMRFRSTVSVGTRSFTSPKAFANRKSAEQDVAKLALEHLLTEDEAWSTRHHEFLRKMISQDKARSKMILNEFTAKIKMESKYETVQVEVTPPVFVSSLALNGTCYQGEGGKNKKEAEQLAALGAILSLLDDPAFSKTISKIIKSKINLDASFYECNNNMEEQQGTLPQIEKQGGGGAVTVSRCSYIQLPVTCSLSSEAAQSGSQQITVPIEFVLPAVPDGVCVPTSSRKRPKSQKKAGIKRLRAQSE